MSNVIFNRLATEIEADYRDTQDTEDSNVTDYIDNNHW